MGPPHGRGSRSSYISSLPSNVMRIPPRAWVYMSVPGCVSCLHRHFLASRFPGPQAIKTRPVVKLSPELWTRRSHSRASICDRPAPPRGPSAGLLPVRISPRRHVTLTAIATSPLAGPSPIPRARAQESGPADIDVLHCLPTVQGACFPVGQRTSLSCLT